MHKPTCPRCAFEIPEEAWSVTKFSTCPRCQADFARGESAEPESFSEMMDTVTTDTQSRKSETPPNRIGRFEVRGLLGQGGFGYVLKGFDPILEREVAIKLPKTDRLSEERVFSIVREARAAAKIRHPNIVVVHEVGQEENLVYIVSDYIPGETLAKRFKQSKPTIQEAVSWAAILARALHHAHAAGVIHRDFKPGNVIFDERGQPLIADFGLALRTSVDASSSETSDFESLGGVIGTPAYMSPEQAAGMGAAASPQSDIYSLGVVLYESLTGSRPFQGDLRGLLQQAIFHDPPSVRALNPDIPSELAAICHRALEKKPENRFPSAMDMAEDLERFLAGKPTKTLPPTRINQFGKFIRRQKWTLAGSVLLTFLTFIAVSMWSQFAGWWTNRCRVLLEVDPPGAQIALVPIDRQTGQLLEERVIRPRTSSRYLLTLDPGWYLVEAYHAQVGVHQVYRYLSRDLADYDGVLDRNPGDFFANRSRSIQRVESDGRVVWPAIRIVPLSELEQTRMVAKMEGGPFQTGSDVFAPMFPLKPTHVSPFILDQTEVTVAQFQKIMNRLPRRFVEDSELKADPENPMNFVEYRDALEYAERIGMRLPTLDEYLYAATNGGQSKFPWGDSPEMIQEWELLKRADYDATKTSPPLFGLYSSLVEWTQTVPKLESPIPPIPPRIRETTGLGDWFNTRFLVGGGPSIRAGKPNALEFAFGPRGFNQAWILEPPQAGIGFRCAQSLQPIYVRPED